LLIAERDRVLATHNYNYYGVSGNYASLQQFFGEAMRILRKWLNRPS